MIEKSIWKIGEGYNIERLSEIRLSHDIAYTENTNNARSSSYGDILMCPMRSINGILGGKADLMRDELNSASLLIFAAQLRVKIPTGN